MEAKNQIFWTIQEAESDFISLLNSPERYLAPKERERYSGMRVEKRKTEWLLGRIAAKALITSQGLPYHGQSYSAIEIANHPEGAPFIKNPSHTTGTLSISHREEVVVCAFCPQLERTLGIDIELIEPREISFVEDFFTQAEADYAKELPFEPRLIWTTLVWSAKEAILKAWQKGLRLDTRSIEIFSINPDDLLSATTWWQPLEWKSKVDGFPDCMLIWQKWDDFIITLAVTVPEEGHGFSIDGIIRIQLSNPLLAD